jgi:List-Bact-rpt repeat protein/HYDIN/CFA65/VesB family protein
VDFGNVNVGSFADRTFTVKNSGEGGPLTGAASTSAPFSVGSGGTFGLGVGESQPVVVRFSPTALGPFTGNVSFTSNGGNVSRAVTGTGGNPVPVLISLSPSSAVQGGPGFTLTGTGSNFVANSVVLWNGVNRTSTFVSSTELRAAIPASDIATAGTAQVTVFTPSPGGGTSDALTFTITPVVNPVLLTASIRGSARGIVTSNPAGMSCPPACSLDFNLGTTVALEAAPGSGARFKGWGGSCRGTATTCTVTMNAAQSVTATFSRIFTDATPADLLPGGTVIRAAHFTELLEAINTARPGTELSWPGPAPSVGSPVLAIHMNTLRQALSLSPVLPGTVIAAQHLNEIRDAIRSLENGGAVAQSLK